MSKTKKDVGAIWHRDGVSFRVWAPFAQSVAVSGSFNSWGHEPMASEGDGYWSAKVKGAKVGQDYKYLINTGVYEMFKNDPRALQVTTSAGNSVIVDQYFDWGDDHFIQRPFNQQVLYELHVGTFNRPDPATSGTFETALEKLDHLVDLGVTTIEIMPVGSMSLEHEWWGYTPDYIYAVESLYGGRHQFLEFVKAAHSRGIGVVLDVVYNHFGPDENLDLWQYDGWSENGKGGIYFYNDWRSQTPWADTRPDYGRPEVQQYILENVRMWLQTCHLDGLRVDSTIFIRNAKGHNDDPDNDLADGWNLLQQINSIGRKIKPGALMIGEDIGSNDYITKPKDAGGAGFSSQWEVSFPHVLREAVDSIDDVYRNLTGIANALTRRYNGDAFQRVLYSDSHDSAANGGARLSEEISPGNPSSIFARERSLLAAAIVLTAPGIPMLFQGQEFMQGGSFNDWQALEWRQAEEFAGIVQAHKHLIALRKNQYGNTAGLCGQSLAILHLNEEAKVLAYHRWDQGGAGDDVIVIVNFANRVQSDYHLDFPRQGTWTVRFNSSWQGYSPDFEPIDLSQIETENVNATGILELAPYSVLILSQDGQG
jgi:1,4-alpha-glucan branching enzyme